MKRISMGAIGLALIHIAATAHAQSISDNTLTPKEKRGGWVLLFDGKTLNGWMTSSNTPSRVPVEEGCIQPHGCGGYMMIHEKMWENFVLSLDFKISKKCNSGVFFRTYSLTPRRDNDVGYNGMEVAIDDSGTNTGFADTGAIYDLVRPTKQTNRPAGEWNRMVLTLEGSKVKVELNGEVVTRTDLDLFTEKNRRPDGTEHKFDEAFRDHPRRGFIGLQDHGSPVWFKNIKLKELPVGVKRQTEPGSGSLWSDPTSHFSSPVQRRDQRRLVSVIEIAAGGKAVGDAGHL